MKDKKKLDCVLIFMILFEIIDQIFLINGLLFIFE